MSLARDGVLVVGLIIGFRPVIPYKYGSLGGACAARHVHNSARSEAWGRIRALSGRTEHEYEEL